MPMTINGSSHGNSTKRLKLDRQTQSNTIVRPEPSHISLALDSNGFSPDRSRSPLDEVLHSYKLGKKQLAQYESQTQPIIECIQSIRSIPAKKIEQHVNSKDAFFPSLRSRFPSTKRIDYSFAPPRRVEKLGDIAIGSNLKQSAYENVDIAVEMPQALFSKEDYLNGAYFHKRAFFLTVIATTLSNEQSSLEGIRFKFLDDDELRPIIVLSKSENNISGLSSSYSIRIIPVAPPSYLSAISASGSLSDSCRASVMADCTMLPCSNLVTKYFVEKLACRDACILGNRWLAAKNLNGSVSGGGFGRLEWLTMVASLAYHIQQKKKAPVSSALTGTFLFKYALEFLATRDLKKDLEIYGHIEDQEPITLKHDLFFKTTNSSFSLLKSKAKHTLDVLLDSRKVPSLFSTTTEGLLCSHDVRVAIPHHIQFNDSLSKPSWNGNITIANYMHECLDKALGDRTSEILVNPPPLSFVSFKQNENDTNKMPLKTTPCFVVSIMLNPKNCRRLVDHGPLVNSDEAAHFRAFWKDKAELRRFKNGEVREAVIWESKLPIVQQILEWVLYSRFSGIAQGTLRISGYEFEAFVPQIPISGHLTSPFEKLRNNFNKLERTLRGLEGLPLHPKEILPYSSALRCASVDISAATDLEGVPDRDVHEVMISFETTSRWPDDLRVIQLVKVSLLAKLANLLSALPEVSSAVVGLDSEIQLSSTRNIGFIDVVFREGYRFRLRVKADNKDLLVTKSFVAGTRSGASDNNSTVHDFADRSAHHEVINRLVTKFEVLSPTIRLVKRWFQSHLLMSHIEEECIELLCVRAFLNPLRDALPGSPSSGFLSCLLFLATWDWKKEPCVVDFESNLSVEQDMLIQGRFSQVRKIDPDCHRFVYFVASNADDSGLVWTNHKPSTAVAHRITALSRSALRILQASLEIPNEIDLKKLFQPSLRDFDFVVYFHRRESQAYRNIQKTVNDAEARATVCVNFLEEIERVFGSSLLLFYDVQDTNIAAFVWRKPDPLTRRVELSEIDPTAAKTLISSNRRAIINQIQRLGGDIINKIVMK